MNSNYGQVTEDRRCGLLMDINISNKLIYRHIFKGGVKLYKSKYTVKSRFDWIFARSIR